MLNANHPAIIAELDILRKLFPGKEQLTLDDYAEYYQINSRYAAQHFSRANKQKIKIAHKRIGKTILISVLDFAYYQAQHKITDSGDLLILPEPDKLSVSMKRRRGFCSN